MKKMLILLPIVLFTLCSSTQNQWIDLEGIVSPTAFYEHGGRFYVVEDGVVIHVFDTDDYRPIHSFGERGDGPGQFNVRPDHSISLFFSGNRILVNSDGKISWFRLDGELISEKATPRPTLRYRPLGESRFVHFGHARDDGIAYFTYVLCDTALNDLNEICRVPNDWQDARGLSAFAISWEFYTVDGRIYHSDRRNGFQIDVYDREGAPLHSIRDEYVPIPVTSAHRDSVHKQYRTSPYTRHRYDEMFKDRIHFPDYLPAIRTWTVNNGKVYAFTFNQKGEKSELRIFTTGGDFLETHYVHLLQNGPDIDRVAPYAIGGNRLYQFVNNRLRITDLK